MKGEGHQKTDNKLCLGFVAWGPISGGARLLDYLSTSPGLSNGLNPSVS